MENKVDKIYSSLIKEKYKDSGITYLYAKWLNAQDEKTYREFDLFFHKYMQDFLKEPNDR